MRVPVYQQQVTPQIPVERSQVTVPEGAAGVAVKPVDTTQGLVQGVESLRLGLVKLNENREQFMLASAVNEFRRANTQYLHAKDTGVFAQKGGQVFGVSGRYDEFAQKTMGDIAKKYKMSGLVLDRFIGSTNALRDSSLSSVMAHEQRESDVARNEVWKSTIADTLNNVALNFNDDKAFNEEVQIGLGAVAQMWAPYGDQVVSSKMNELMSQCQVVRVGAMLEENPKAADAYLKAHKSEFTGADYMKVQKAVDNQMEVIKVQETTDFLVKKFRGNEAAALQFAHKNYEGQFENSLVSALKSRFSEQKLETQLARAGQTARQNAAMQALFADASKGTFYTDEQLRASGFNDSQINKYKSAIAKGFKENIETAIAQKKPVDLSKIPPGFLSAKEIAAFEKKSQDMVATEAKEFMAGGQRLTAKDIDKLPTSNIHKAELKSVAAQQETADYWEKQLPVQVGGAYWSSLTPAAQAKAIRRKIGVGDDQHKRMLVQTYEEYLAGDIPDTTVNLRASFAQISRQEAADIFKAKKDRDAVQKMEDKLQEQYLDNTIKAVQKEKPDFDPSDIKLEFFTQVNNIPDAAPKRMERVKSITQGLQARVLTDSGISLSGFLGLNRFGKMKNEIQTRDFTGTHDYPVVEPKSVTEARGGNVAIKETANGRTVINGRTASDVLFNKK